MITIVSTNDNYGDPIEISSDSLESAVAELQQAVRNCGPAFADVVITPDDFDIVLVKACE